TTFYDVIFDLRTTYFRVNMAEEFVFDPTKNYDEATMAQMRAMEKEIVENQNLISDRLKVLKKKADTINTLNNKIINHFDLETELMDRKEFTDVARKSKNELVSLGFPEFTIEDFHETFMEVVGKVVKQCSLEELLETFNDQGLSDYIVVYLRLMVSGYLQKEADFYGSFLEGDRTMKEFCGQEVEPMGKESDHIHIIALTSSLGVPVRVEYMDRGDSSACNHHDFPEDSAPFITLLYRPGHYDILYS
ncbi:OTUB1-like protein, partial [Mya arenaria]